MTEQERIWFDRLQKKLQNAWNVFSDPRFRGLFDSLIYKYNDSAHFLYEMLQNADDAGATDVEITLETGRIILTHNGTERFTISDVETEKKDRARGRLGHINAITAINFSSKVAIEEEIEKNKIGKFGIGFKAVYQYTNTPHIYDDGICFKIENFIVPTLLDDTSLVQKGKTVFVLPFDKAETAADAYTKIENKLRALEHPQLFLNHIKRIKWKSQTAEGVFTQQTIRDYNFEDLSIKAERLKIEDSTEKATELLKLTRNVAIPNEGVFPISIVYYLSDNTTIDTSSRRRLYCFFPTNESVGTCYAIHAPFLLTESRQTLRGDEEINKRLFEEIAKLAADSLVALRDISKAESRFLLGDNLNDLRKVSPNNLSNRWELIEGGLFEKNYKRVFLSEALFLSSQQRYLMATEACWTTKEMQALLSPTQLCELTGKKDFVLCSCTNYLREVNGLGVNEFGSKDLSQALTTYFLSRQSDEWLDKFYGFVVSYSSKLEDNNEQSHALGVFSCARIFKTDANTFVPAFDSKGNPTLFLFTEGITKAWECVNQALLQSSKNLSCLVEKLGLSKKNRLDYIRMLLTDEQKQWSQENANDFWKVMINYWDQCNDDGKKELSIILKERLWLRCDRQGYTQQRYTQLDDLYLYSDDLANYFDRAANQYHWYLESTKYSQKIKDEKLNKIRQQKFFREDYYNQAKSACGETFDKFVEWLGIDRTYPRVIRTKEYPSYIYIDNLYRVVRFISDVKIDTRELQEAVEKLSHYVWEVLSFYLEDLRKFAIGDYTELIPKSKRGSLIDFLKGKKWILVGGERVTTQVTSQEHLFHAGYEGKKLMNCLGIETHKEVSYSQEALKSVLGPDFHLDDNQLKTLVNKLLKLMQSNEDKEESSTELLPDRSIEDVIEKEYAEQLPRYTYKWFAYLINLEAKASGTPDEETKRRALKVNFSSVIFPAEGDTVRLECASRYVPTSVEEIDNLEVAFHLLDGSQKKVSFDAVSVKDSVLTLKVKQQQKHEIDLLRQDKKRILQAEINCERPIELLQSWKSLIEREMSFLPYDYSLKENLYNFIGHDKRNVEFIFGPPGTGKTYQLAQRIISLMNRGQAQRILVLAPTNKACDVLVEKIMDLAPSESPWLCRFAKTLSERIESTGLVHYHDTPLDNQTCLVTTIARYAYDNCTEGALRQLDWDYAFIDEASMIPLYQIVAPLYNDKLRNVIIAGDPFQIQPIVCEDLWKDENIYTMLELQNFARPTTSPAGFRVETLTTQRRSIPDIGELYSRYAYNGLLKHHRLASDSRLLNMGLHAQPLNIITFPVTKESTFAPHRMKGSNIQVYSFILVVELLKYITRNIAQAHGGEEVSIGVVGPYSAEVQAISKMYEQLGQHYENISVSFGTAHGFQGDECNIVIAIMNPPASGLIRKAQQTFINNRNILNVSISRATDYLFVVMPDENFENADKLEELNKLTAIMKGMNCARFSHNDIEHIIYGRKGVIEENTFVTTHQMTNVYSDFSKKYEVRIDDTSIDIQVNLNDTSSSSR